MECEGINAWKEIKDLMKFLNQKGYLGNISANSKVSPKEGFGVQLWRMLWQLRKKMKCPQLQIYEHISTKKQGVRLSKFGDVMKFSYLTPKNLKEISFDFQGQKNWLLCTVCSLMAQSRQGLLNWPTFEFSLEICKPSALQILNLDAAKESAQPNAHR